MALPKIEVQVCRFRCAHPECVRKSNTYSIFTYQEHAAHHYQKDYSTIEHFSHKCCSCNAYFYQTHCAAAHQYEKNCQSHQVVELPRPEFPTLEASSRERFQRGPMARFLLCYLGAYLRPANCETKQLDIPRPVSDPSNSTNAQQLPIPRSRPATPASARSRPGTPATTHHPQSRPHTPSSSRPGTPSASRSSRFSVADSLADNNISHSSTSTSDQQKGLRKSKLSEELQQEHAMRSRGVKNTRNNRGSALLLDQDMELLQKSPGRPPARSYSRSGSRTPECRTPPYQPTTPAYGTPGYSTPGTPIDEYRQISRSPAYEEKAYRSPANYHSDNSRMPAYMNQSAQEHASSSSRQPTSQLPQDMDHPSYSKYKMTDLGASSQQIPNNSHPYSSVNSAQANSSDMSISTDELLKPDVSSHFAQKNKENGGSSQLKTNPSGPSIDKQPSATPSIEEIVVKKSLSRTPSAENSNGIHGGSVSGDVVHTQPHNENQPPPPPAPGPYTPPPLQSQPPNSFAPANGFNYNQPPPGCVPGNNLHYQHQQIPQQWNPAQLPPMPGFDPNYYMYMQNMHRGGRGPPPPPRYFGHYGGPAYPPNMPPPFSNGYGMPPPIPVAPVPAPSIPAPSTRQARFDVRPNARAPMSHESTASRNTDILSQSLPVPVPPPRAAASDSHGSATSSSSSRTNVASANPPAPTALKPGLPAPPKLPPAKAKAGGFPGSTYNVGNRPSGQTIERAKGIQHLEFHEYAPRGLQKDNFKPCRRSRSRSPGPAAYSRSRAGTPARDSRSRSRTPAKSPGRRRQTPSTSPPPSSSRDRNRRSADRRRESNGGGDSYRSDRSFGGGSQRNEERNSNRKGKRPYSPEKSFSEKRSRRGNSPQKDQNAKSSSRNDRSPSYDRSPRSSP